MSQQGESSRAAILRAAADVIRERGAGGLTTEAVARSAHCAKGLVHYHFKTKRALLQATADHLAQERQTRWVAALRAKTPQEAIKRSWDLLSGESRDGTARAWASLLADAGTLPGQTANELSTRFSGALAEGAIAVLGEIGLRPTVPALEIGWLLAAVINGTGLHLASGVSPDALEGAYAAAWLGILSLFAPASS